MDFIKSQDPAVAEILEAEESRTRRQLKMIPSENYVSKAVREALGSMVMNKYSEGQVGKRYYMGNQEVDRLEQLAKDRAIELFGLTGTDWGVCVQAVSGSVANLAVYNAVLNKGDKIMGMYLYDGGHLSHGWKLPDGKPISFTSQAYESHFYYVDVATGKFDYDDVAEQIRAVKPAIVISGGTAYPREIDHSRLSEIAREIGAFYMADIAHEAGLVAGGVHSSPFEYADIVTMTTRKTLRGPVGSMIFAKGDMIDEISRAVMPGLQGGPLNHSIAGIAVALGEANTDEFKEYAAQIVKNAKALADELLRLGHTLVSGGTDKHLMLIDLTELGINGDRAAKRLEDASIIVNKNTIPGEKSTSWKPSGIRIGTPSLTSRGMVEEDMVKIASWIDQVLRNTRDKELIKSVKAEVESFATKFDVRGLD